MAYRIVQKNINTGSVLPLTIWFASLDHANSRLSEYWSDKSEYRYELQSDLYDDSAIFQCGECGHDAALWECLTAESAELYRMKNPLGNDAYSGKSCPCCGSHRVFFISEPVK